jgi:DNA-binding response OmpR family regulator
MPSLKRPILIVEDDQNTASLVATYLENEGFTTLHAADGLSALRLARKEQPGFLILDVMLPKMDGWDVCRELRKFSDVPILMLTAREEEIDRIMGLSLGADDYVVKPFSPRELVERVKAILRRTTPRRASQDQVLQFRGLVLDPVRCRVSRDGTVINLTNTEYKLLHTLMSSPGRVFSRQTLLSNFYDHGDAVIDRVIDVHIGKLRQKIEDDSANPRFIETVRGFGYRFIDSEES